MLRRGCYGSLMSGEEAHEKGRDGAQRAKLWLESTTRVNACWVNLTSLQSRSCPSLGLREAAYPSAMTSAGYFSKATLQVRLSSLK